MKIEVYYEAPDADIIELNEDQEAAWLAYRSKLEEARAAQREKGWTAATPLYTEADTLYEDLIEELYFSLQYPEFEIEDIQEW